MWEIQFSVHYGSLVIPVWLVFVPESNHRTLDHRVAFLPASVSHLQNGIAWLP